MSGKLVGEVMKNAPEDLSPAQLLVLIALAEDARDKERIARYSSVANLAKLTRLAPGSIKNILGVLTGRGLIKPMHRAQHGTVQHYRIHELYDYHRNATITPTEAK